MLSVLFIGACRGPLCSFPCHEEPCLMYYDASCDVCVSPCGSKMVAETSARGAASTQTQVVGRAKGVIHFSDFEERVASAISGVDEEFLLMEIKAAIAADYDLDKGSERTIVPRQVSLTVRKHEGGVVFLCRIIATIHPTAKKVEFDITCGGNVDASTEKFNRVAKELKTRLLTALGKAS